MKNNIKILAIETSCDETAAAVICVAKKSNKKQETNSKQISNLKSQIPNNNIAIQQCNNDFPVVLSSVVSSSVNLHAKTGGIVPEVASRAQMECILPVVIEALSKSNEKLITNKEKLLKGITHIAVTNGPGLIGSLLVGFNAAKTIAYAKNLPLIPINHIEGHIYSAYAESNPKSETLNSKQNQKAEYRMQFPVLALTVSGGHTSLTLMHDHGKYQTLGETIDDAAGEAFDKVAKLLELGYPGGPAVSQKAAAFRGKFPISKSQTNPKFQNSNKSNSYQATAIKFPRPLIDKPNFDFSFSGLKTAVLTEVIKNGVNGLYRKEEICFAFEEAVVDVLCTKTVRAAKKYKPKTVILAGGVAANKHLREEMQVRLDEINVKFLMPEMSFCGDNAVMIGIAAYYHILKRDISELFETTVDSNLELTSS